MNRDEFLDRYFAEFDLGPRYRLRESFGGVLSPNDRATESALDDENSVGNVSAQAHLQKKSPNATSPHLPKAGAGRPALATALKPQPVAASQLPPNMDWQALEQAVHDCQSCSLFRQRRQAICGNGDRQADWLIIGDAPNSDDDTCGELFSGMAGKLLDNMLGAIGLTRNDSVYLTNAVKCRPPNNRLPELKEMASCKGFLDRQIALLKPKLILVFGQTLAGSLLGREGLLDDLRGQIHQYGALPVVVLPHPKDLLRQPLDKAKAWADLCLAVKTMQSLADD